MDKPCPDCPIGGRDGSGPVCPHVAACDRQCVELVEACGVRCGLRRDLMEAAEGYTDTPSPLETIRQRWAAHVRPRSIVVVDDLGGGVYGVRDLRPEEAALMRAPEDVVWLLAEVERLRAALVATEHDVCQTLGAPEIGWTWEAADRIRGLKLSRG